MCRKKLKTAILGLNEKGLELLNAAEQTGLFDIVAVADSNADLAEKISRKYDCPAFADYRQLVIQSQFDVLIVAAATHVCGEYLRAAMKKKCNIIKVVPPALDFKQAAEFAGMVKKNHTRFFVASDWHFWPSFCALADYLHTEGTQGIHLITALCNVPQKSPQVHDRWLSDPKLAGGGVLLRNCYEIIEQIILNFGLPEQVYALNTNHAPDKQQRLSITEDTVVLTMKFYDTLTGNLIASRIFGPPQQVLRIYSTDRILTLCRDSFTICDNLGNTIEQFKYDTTAAQTTVKMLESFALTLITADEKTSADYNNAELYSMAVIESAYLSARTAMPEEPSRILKLVKAEATTIWPAGD